MPSPAATRLWHPFADMSAVDGHELELVRAEGAWVWDAAGRRYLDGTAGLWYANVGHGREELARRAAEQMGRLDAYGAFGDLTNPPARELSERLTELAPVDDARVFLTTGGGEAIDTAVKLARRYWHAVGRPERSWVVSRQHGYHGTNGYGTSIGGLAPNRAAFGPLAGDAALVAHDDLDALARRFEELGPEQVAAFVCEPVIGAGGVRLPPPGYLEGAAALCRRHGILFVADSVICGFGRLGSWFGVERWGLRPDMITFAKGVTSGTLPLGGVIVSGQVAEPFWTTPGLVFRHGATYAAHPTCCAVALANLDLLEQDGLVERGAVLERPLADALAPLADHPAVSEVRSGIGLLAAVELTEEVRAADPGAVGTFAARARDAGLLARALPTALAVSPPLIVEPEQVRLLADALADALDRLAVAA